MKKRGFILLELIVAIVIIGVIIFTLFQIYSFVNLSSEENKNVYLAGELKKNMEKGLKDNLDAFILDDDNVFIEGINSANFLDEGNVLTYQKTVPVRGDDVSLIWQPLFANVDEDGTWFEGGNDATDTINPQKMVKRLSFWESELKGMNPVIAIVQKYHKTTTGVIPYDDIYVAVIPAKFMTPIKSSLELRKEFFDSFFDVSISHINLYNASGLNITTSHGAVGKPEEYSFVENVMLKDYVAKDDRTDKYKTESGIDDKEFFRLKDSIMFFKLSTKDLMLDRYNKSVEKINSYAKNLKDWASVQANTYENVVANIGGNLNIDYFVSKVSRGFKSSKEYNKMVPTMLFSSSLLDRTPGATDRTSDMDWTTGNTIDIFDPSTTRAGMVISTLGQNTIRYTDNFVNNLRIVNKQTPVYIKNAIALDAPTDMLMIGSKLILGINNATQDIFGNGFDDNYKIFFSNTREYGATVNLSGGRGSKTYNFLQNVPLNEKSNAPFTSVFFTLYPWAGFKLAPTPGFGYYEIKISPELR